MYRWISAYATVTNADAATDTSATRKQLGLDPSTAAVWPAHLTIGHRNNVKSLDQVIW